MKLQTLRLEQYRNYPKLELQFDPRQPITTIVGENAQGKTNILEAIYLLALTKSFRTSHHDDLIGWNDEFARIQGVFETDTADDFRIPGDAALNGAANVSTSDSLPGTLQLEIFLGKPPQPLKVHKKNGVKISSGDFIGNCQVVFFHPEDLNMLYLGPELRRKYLDILLVQVRKGYFKALRAYRRVMEQRNALLWAISEGRASTKDLEIWNTQLVENGSLIMFERAKAVEYLRRRLEDNYRHISQSDENVELHYLHTLGVGEPRPHKLSSQTPPNHPDFLALDSLKNFQDLASIQSHYQASLANAQKRDLQSKMTTIGPHRDDLEFTLNHKKLSAHASRGEYRSLLLALKLLELQFYHDYTGQKPMLLLDDVFSELDEKRQGMLMESVRGHQTILTTTQNPETQSAFLKTSQVVRIHGGQKES